YAVTDEIHQHFVEGRSCELRDVLIDAAGALLFLLLWWAVLQFLRRKKQSVSE
ncbi:MAG: VanZ family protein, partial [Clostridia bacterium]|nr:VanZ family protein [Clostridia bacterium]